MTILTHESLEFTRRHFERFDDADFFPRQEEFAAIRDNWEEFSARLTAENVTRMKITPAETMPVAKGRASYRIVHQLEPMTAIVYSSLVRTVAPALEAARADLDTACSYRFHPEDGAFFSGSQGYDRYRAQSENLSQQHDYGAAIDVADFYNQIYSHRVRGSIEAASGDLSKTAHDIERVIHAINTGASKGIPVGCDASAMLAEGILIHVDQLLARSGVAHTRYVDDIRLFSNDPQRLQTAIENVSEYLYEQHRLHLNSSKTKLLPSDAFIDQVVHDHLDTETQAAMELLGQLDPYGEVELNESDLPPHAVIEQIGGIIYERFQESGFVDLNLIKGYIRRSRIAGSTNFVDVAIAATEAFIPAIHELARAMLAVCAAGEVETLRPLVEHLRASPHYQRKAVRHWLDWVCAGSSELMQNPDIRDSVFASGIRVQAKGALTTQDLAWVRAQRATFIYLPPMQRTAVIRSMQLIGADERRHLLQQVDDRTASPVDIAVKRSVLSR